MELKRILARDSRSASEEAMEKYGRDVLIISSNRVNGQTELIVAIDVATSAHAPVSKPASSVATTTRANDEEEHNAFEELLFAQHGATQTAPSAPPAEPPQTAELNPAMASAQELATQYDTMRGSEIVALLKEELGAIRQEIRLHQQLGLTQVDALAPSLQPLMDELVERGMPPGLSEHMTQAWRSLDDPIEALASLESELTRVLPPSQAPVSLHGVHALVGPSGAGKSLACAKLANLASDALGPEAVAWISFADHRAGAWSQTQVLAAPSGVATFRAGNAQGLQLLLEELSHLKLILIDTAGVDFEQQLASLREVTPELQAHMVLPMDATLTSIKRALKTHAHLATVVLTKLDECHAPWAMIQALGQRKVQVAWINDSERPHAPLQVYTPQTLAENALNTLGQTDDEEWPDEYAAKALRLHDMHEVPDLTETLEPFGEPDVTPASSPNTMRTDFEDSYGVPQFARIHLAS